MGNVYKVLGQAKINPTPASFPTRMVIELCECIHLHYRNLRIEFSDSEFYGFALCVYYAMHHFLKERMNKLEKKIIPLDQINPYDSGHGEIPDIEHREYIDILKEKIKKGAKIYPILVKPVEGKPYKYQRLDGYKRYMAMKELGFTEIECFIDPQGWLGGQFTLPSTLWKEEKCLEKDK